MGKADQFKSTKVSAVPWACPGCGAKYDGHGKGECQSLTQSGGGNCGGFICECDFETTDGHGDTPEDPCGHARCHHCEWAGTFPPLPYKLKGWAKKAWDEGWRPPAGWQP